MKALTRAMTPEMYTVGLGGLQDKKGKDSLVENSQWGPAAVTTGGWGQFEGREEKQEGYCITTTWPLGSGHLWSPPEGGQAEPRGKLILANSRGVAGKHFPFVLWFILNPQFVTTASSVVLVQITDTGAP